MSDATPAPGSGDVFRRRAQRTEFQKRTQIHLLHSAGAGATAAVELCNYSPVGIGFLSDISLERGQQFTMRVTPPNKSPVDMLYAVAHCAPAPHKKFRIGAEFVCTLVDAKCPDLLPDSEVLKDRIRRAVLT